MPGLNSIATRYIPVIGLRNSSWIAWGRFLARLRKPTITRIFKCIDGRARAWQRCCVCGCRARRCWPGRRRSFRTTPPSASTQSAILHSADGGPKGFQNTLQPELMGRLNGHQENWLLEGGAQADLLLMFNGISQGSSSPSTYFELPELYGGTSLQEVPVQILAGRKLEHWSHLDEQWSLGIWQPRFRWDYLHPEEVGLTGAFLRVEQPLFRFVGLFSPIFIPERGVPISTDGGTFASDSRWFLPPPASVNLFGQNTPMQYSLMMPQLSSLLEHPGASVMARVGREQGAWGSLGYAYKPVNQLILGETGLLQLNTDPNAIHGTADIYPARDLPRARVGRRRLSERALQRLVFRCWASIRSWTRLPRT